MADLSDLVGLIQLVYNVDNPPNVNGWEPLQVTGNSGEDALLGFKAQAFQNGNQIVIVIRGTVDTAANFINDASLTVHEEFVESQLAITFARAVIAQYPGNTFTITGHSLGGYAAQAAYANIATSSGPPPPAGLTAVVFNAPGLPSNLANGLGSGAAVYNFNTVGDWVHLAGGTQIGKSTTLNVGPTVQQEWNSAAEGFEDGPDGVGEGLIGGFTNLFQSVLGPQGAHTIDNFSNYFGAANNPNQLGILSAQNFFGNGDGGPPNSNLSINPTTGAISLGDGTGNVFTYLPQTNGSATLSLAAANGAGLLGSGTLAGLQSEIAAQGPITAPTTLFNQNVGTELGAPALFAAVRNDGGASSVVIGSSAPGGSSGGPNQLYSPGDSIASFDFVVPASGHSFAETITGAGGIGTIWVSGADGRNQLLGGAPETTVSDTWMDTQGTLYTFSGSPGSAVGSLTISNGALGPNLANNIVISDFNLAAAHTAGGFLGIQLPETLAINASANSGFGSPAPNFYQGSNQSYTLSVDVPSATSQVITVTLANATPSDFSALVGDTVEQLNSNKSFNVTLAAGETHVSFTLMDTTADSGGSDIASGANISLSASVASPDSLIGGTIQSAPLSFLYVPTSWETDAETQPSDVIAGTGTDTLTYSGDGGDDFITTTATTNIVNAQNSGDDSIVGNSAINLITVGGGNSIIVGNGGTDVIVAGTGNNEIYAGSKIGLQNAITQVGIGTPTGVKGDLISVLDGDNTIIGGNGNDIAVAGSGSNVIVLGPGQDTFYGGLDLTFASESWNLGGGVLNPVTVYDEGYTNLFAQPYNGNAYENIDVPGDTIASAANDTVFGGNGNDLFVLGNGNNDVEVGNGNSTVGVGMGNNTVVAGSGADLIGGGGGTEYIYGGSGADTLFGGNGSNTIIGGSGNSLIISSEAPAGFDVPFLNDNLVQNYVTGGSGNDSIYGSPGSDTLIAGTGNSSIFGGSGSENIIGGSGNDWLQGGSGNTTIDAGGNGVDTLLAAGSSSATSIIYGGNGTDYIQGGSGSNFLYAGDGGTAGGPTTVFASPFDSTATTTIYGGLGVDLLEGGTGSDVIYGGDGGSATAFTTVLGGTGNETLYGGLGTDFVQGGSGTDELFAGDGGTTAAPETVSGGTGVATLTGGAGPSLLEDVESGSDLIIAGTSDDTLIGIGSDTLVAGPGDDGLQVNSGSVTFDFNAGFGNDNINEVTGTENVVFGTGIEATDFSGSVSRDVAGNTYLDLSGDGGSVAIQGALTGALNSVDFADSGPIALPTLMTDAFGGDSIFSSGSNFVVVAVTSNESVAALTGNDTISAWGNGETISGANAGFGDQIYSDGSGASIKSVSGTDTINAAGANDSITGGSNIDHITVSGAGSKVTSTTANDVITASGNADTLVGGSGNSTYFINNASVIVQASGGGTDTIFASVSYTAPTNVSVLTLVGSANIAATGNAGSDTLTGGAGVDSLIAGSGAATLVGGSGNTTFVVNSASDFVQDSSGTANNAVQSSVNYVLPTNVNNLVLTGTAALTGTANAANDTLTSNAGVDTLIGGVGNDTFILNNPNDVVQDTAGTATIVYQSATNFTLPVNVNILTLTGTAALQATGNAANDLISANAGADTLVAGNGTDTLVSGLGVGSLVGGTGNDLFVVNNASDIVTVGATHGADTIQSSVSFTASANVADLTLMGSASAAATGNSLANLLTANSGNDTLIAGSGIATLVGGAGNDTFVVNSTNDLVQDSTIGALNTLQTSVSFTLAVNVNSLMFTGTAALVCTGNSGADTLTANTGADTLIGGSGNDTFIISNAADVVQDTSGTASNSILSSVNFTLPTDVNTLMLTGTAALIATGNAGPDLISANSGADTLIAASAGDTLVSGSGAAADSLVGGPSGDDLFVVNNALDTVSSSAANPDSVQSAVSFTLPTNVSYLTLTGTANLVGTAVSGNNSITGNAGSDTLIAGSGIDTLSAGSGIDTLISGTGTDDTFVINNAADVILGTLTGDKVVSSVSYTMPAGLFGLTLTGTANLVGAENNTAGFMKANSGNDTLVSGSGNTELFGGLGADVFVINNSSDDITEQFSKAAIDTVESSVSFTMSNFGSLLQGNVLALIGSANLVGTENGNAALVMGNAGLDTLIAAGNEDTLTAGSGVATLIGGNGNDTFVINNVSDVIQDTVVGHNNVLASSVAYTLPTNVNTLLLTGTAALVATANATNDSLRGNAGADTLVAGIGSDTLVAGAGLATLKGGAGSDTFVINNSADVIQNASASGQNVLISSASYTLPTNVNVLTLTGIANINGVGNGVADTLTAGAGQDTLTAGAGITTLIGGTGNDTFVVNSTSDVVQDASATTSNTIQSSVNYSLVTDVNTLILSGTAALKGTANSANDTLISNNALDTLVGGTGNDTFVISNSADIVQDTSTSAINTAQSSVSYTLAANVNTLILTGTAALIGTANGSADTLVSNSGADTLVGGTSNDTFVVNNALDVVQDTSTTTTNVIQSSANYTLPTHVNALTLIGSAALTATGNAAADVITANSGNDTLSAGSGVATLVGGAGNDTFVVNSVSDVVVDSATSTSNTIQSSVSFTLAANVNNLQITGTSALEGTANSGSDTLISNSGIDTLVGGSGPDLFIINNASDVIQNATSNDTVESSVSYSLPANVTSLILVGSANIQGTGNSSADFLTAGTGIDTLVAGTGIATMTGGTGNDTFVVNNINDVVLDSSTTSSNTIQSSVNFSLPANVDSLVLTGSTALTLTGNADENNVLTANGGNDSLVGVAINNTINGGAGIDTINAGPELNVINAGNGGTSTQATGVFGNATGTNVTTQSTIYGGSGFDSLYGGAGSDLIYGGSGSDSLIGGSGVELLYAGTGGTALNPTVLFPGSGADTLYGGSGTDVLDDDIVTNPGTALLVAGTGNNTLDGFGHDTLIAGSGSDVLAGFSTISHPNQSTFVLNANFTNIRVEQASGNGGIDNLQFGTGLSPTAMTVTGASGAVAGTFSLEVIGPNGTASIDGGFSPGIINSIDFVDSGSLTLSQFIAGAVAVPDTVTTGSTGIIFSAVNNANVTNGATADSVYGFGNNDTLTAGTAGGSLFAYGNDSDLVVGTSGGNMEASGTADTLNGSTASGIQFIVDNATDIVSQTTSDGGLDTVQASVSYTLPTNVTNLRLTGSANIVGTGNSGNSWITGNSGNDTLVAGSGSATIQAGSGNQLLEGGAGARNILTAGSGTDTLSDGTGATTLNAGSGTDTFVVNNLSDVIQDIPVGAHDTVETSVSFNGTTGETTILATGSANIQLTSVGNSAATLVGGAGNDTIELFAAGMLIGGTGITDVAATTNVTMVGGTGADNFTVLYASDVIQNGKASDTITSAISYTLPSSIGTLALATDAIDLTGVGNSLNDTLIAGPDDTLIAGAGLATMIGASGGIYNDTYVINNGGDVILNGHSTDTIQSSVSYTLPTSVNILDLTGSGNLIAAATAGNNQLLGNSGNDTLTGGTGNDTLVAGAGADTLIGGSGTDTFIINSASDVVQDSSSSTSNAVQSSVSYLLAANFNSLTLLGTANLVGSASSGTDTLTSNSGVDTLVGGAGNDTFVINNTSDTIQDTSSIAANVAISAVTFTLPTDVNSLILTGSAAIVGTANSGNDSLTGNAGANTLIGGSGVDTLTAGAAADTLLGGTGNTTFVVNSVSDVVQDTLMSAANVLRSSVSYVLPTNVNSLILTGASALTGTANNGNDTLTSNTGLDTLVGGSGNDTFIVSHAGDIVQDTSGTATNVVLSSVAFTLPTDVNTLTFTGSTALHGTGNAGNDSMTANSGADTLSAGNGTDTLVSGTTGADSLVAGTGNDLFVVNFASDVVSVGTTHGNDTIQSSVTYTASANVTTLTLIGTAAITGTGNSLSDTISANSGADTLTAGSGVATLVGGSGNDTFVINSASDVIQDSSATATNILSSSVSYTVPTNVNRLILTGTAALVGTANSANDTLTANTGADTLVSGAGSAVDSLVAGTGADLFVVNNASDIVTVGGTHGVDTIQSSVSYTASTNVANLALTGTGALAATGNALAGTITANSGSDTLTAGTGADTLVAGSANDLFVINSASDVVSVGATHGVDTIQSSVTYTASANVANLTLTGTSALVGTGNSLANTITANSGADTLTAGSGVATLVGGAGNDTFVVNSVSDVVQDTSTTATNILSSSVSYTLATNVNRLILTGTAALVGTANSGNDTLTANTGADTLVSGAGTAVDSLVAGTGADLFVVNNASDIVTVGGTHGVDTIQSSVSYTASTNVANLTLTGTSALAGTGNSLAGTITANTGNDTLTAGTGADTLVGSSTGTDLFVVNSASDVVSLGTSGTSDSIQSSASYTLPTNVQYLTLSGTSALTGTGNSLTDLIVGNSGADTLVGGTGIAVLEGGRTAGSDQIKALSNQAALIGGAAASTLTGGAFKDFYAAGTVSDSITTGATANVVSVNKGDGATTLAPTTSATNVLSLGAGIDTESLFFTKTGNNLILTDGVTGDSITFTNWYAGAADQDYTTLQVVEIASANYNSGGGDGLRNKALEAFNFTALVAAYNTAGSPANWALSTAMPTTSLATTSTADYGGDLAYYFGLNGNLTGMDLSAAQSTLTNASFGTATQTIDAFSGISGGGGLHLSVALPPQRITPIREPQFRDGEDLVSAISPEFGIQLRPSAGSPDANIATLNEQSDQNLVINMGPDVELPSAASTVAASVPAAANTESLGPRLRLPEDNAAFGDFTLDEDSRLDTARVIASPQVRDGVAPEVSTIQTPATSQAMTAGSISELSGIPVSTGQLIASPSVMPGVNIPSAFQPQISLSDDFLRDIAPRLALPVSPGAAPATSGIEAPPMSSALSVAPPMVTTEPSEIFGPPNISESQGSAVLMQEDGIAQRLISPGRLPQLLDYVLPASAESPIASVQPTIATARIGATITPVKVSDIATMLDSSNVPPPVIPQASINWSESLPNNLVDPINVAWLTMHDALNQSNSMPIGGSEVPSNPSVGANDALVAGGPIDRMQRIPDELELHSQRLHQRAM